MPRPRAEPPEPVRLALGRPLTPPEAAHVCCELAATLLFLRAQLPGLYADVRDQLAAEEQQDEGLGAERPPRRRRTTASERRARKTVAAVEALHALLRPGLFADGDVQAVLLLLGSSASRPREAYELRLDVDRGAPAPASTPQSPPPPPRNAATDVARRVTRSLVQSLVSAPEPPSGAAAPGASPALPCAPCGAAGADAPPAALKLFVLLRAPADARLPDGFLPKRTLRPAFHRAKVLRSVHVAAPDAPDAAAAPASPPPSPSAAGTAHEAGAPTEDSSIWYQCAVVVRGLPRASSR